MNKLTLIGGLLIIPMIIIIMILSTANIHEEIVKCYDKHNNEIIGVDCYGDKYDKEFMNDESFIWLVIISMILFLIGVGTILISVSGT